jgi:hypothetical protein
VHTAGEATEAILAHALAAQLLISCANSGARLVSGKKEALNLNVDEYEVIRTVEARYACDRNPEARGDRCLSP